ncbi:hypothetical protein C2845_PM07G02640 [Panicum miliaceum]|uniref:Uncharacterized protein n=1 Tax=Panicum miliaceum TaxID=4540 RepID=A0A3L6SNQ8_PANMI|nr:hypothetical protein C2845_PM07G02640 [Panicum miliaceum]
MAAGPLGDGAAVSVVLVRATASPPALPRYTCTFYANPPPGAADLEGDTSSRPCRELLLSVRIDRASGPEPPVQDKKMITES